MVRIDSPESQKFKQLSFILRKHDCEQLEICTKILGSVCYETIKTKSPLNSGVLFFCAVNSQHELYVVDTVVSALASSF